MPLNNTGNYGKITLRTFHATPKTVVLRDLLGIHNNQQRFPNVADVRVGTVYGPSVFDQQGYLTGTMVAGGGSAVFRVAGSSICDGARHMSPVSLGDAVFPTFPTTSSTTGAATNADSPPVVSIEEDGVAMGYAPTVTNVATGLYRVQIDATTGNGFEAGKRYSAYYTATVGGVTGCAAIGEFEVLTLDLNATLNATVSSRLSLNQFVGLS